MARKKTRAQLETELKLVRRMNLRQGIWGTTQSLIRWGGLVAIAWFAYLMVAELAGKETMAAIAVEFLADMKFVSSVTLAGGGVGYGFWQRRLRRRQIASMQSRVKTLEQALDKARSSSKLTETGQTNPEDL